MFLLLLLLILFGYSLMDLKLLELPMCHYLGSGRSPENCRIPIRRCVVGGMELEVETCTAQARSTISWCSYQAGSPMPTQHLQNGCYPVSADSVHAYNV